MHIITEDSLTQLVHQFYQKVRANSKLGPVFHRAIGTTDKQWKHHLETIVDFWSTLMLGTGRYQSNPMQKHLDLPPFPRELFSIWLQLFAETAHETHAPEQAQLLIDRSESIADTMQYMLYERSL